jgi:hypothetical protein
LTKLYSREEFYELVWSKPITHWAKEFRLSDVAIHKICRKHDIPTPPPGWWAKLAAGHAVDKTLLPTIISKRDSKIVIVSADLNKESEALVMVREQARIKASMRDEKSLLPTHPILEWTLKNLRTAGMSENGVVATKGPNLITCAIAPNSIDRIGLALPRIFAAVSLQGFQVVEGSQSAEFSNNTERVSFSIIETTKRVPHELNPTERAEQAEFEQKYNKARQRPKFNAFDFWASTFPQWDMKPTGQLSFELEHVYAANHSTPRKSFKDGKTQKLETLVEDISVGLAVLAAAKTERRLWDKAQEHKRQDEKLRRENVARRKYIEERRQKGLTTILAELDELDKVRFLISKLEAEELKSELPRFSSFLHWTRENLEQRQRQLTSTAVEARFSNDCLFGEDDDQGFKPIAYY